MSGPSVDGGPSGRTHASSGEASSAQARVPASAHVHGAECVHHAALDAVRAGHPEVRRRLGWALGLTAGFMLAEVAGGLVSNSLALLADAGHMLTDAGALALALGVAAWNARHPEETAGARRREAWAALVNAGVLVVVVLGIVIEALGRFAAPEPVRTGVMLGVATIGLAVNVGAALVLRPVVRDNLNARGAYLHVLGDLLGSIGTIVAALLIQRWGWLWADPITSLLVAALVTHAVVGLVAEARETLRSPTHHAP